MSNYIMQVDFFGNDIRCETEKLTLSLNDLFNAGNLWRLNNKQAPLQLASFINSVTTKRYIKAAAKEWGLPEEDFLFKTGKGKYTRTMAHISVALLAAETISPEFHARAHKQFIDGKILEFREFGGTEFKKLNVAIDQYLPEREGKSNLGIFINVAKIINHKLSNSEDKIDWDKASVGQIHSRYEIEKKISDYLEQGFVRNYDHLKEILKGLKQC